MSEEKPKRDVIRIFVLSLGTLLALFFLLSVGPKLIGPLFVDSPHGALPGDTWEEYVITATFTVYLIGYALSWWRPRWGGVIMILSALLVMLPFIILHANYGSLIFGIPQLVVGVLYIWLHAREKRRAV